MTKEIAEIGSNIARIADALERISALVNAPSTTGRIKPCSEYPCCGDACTQHDRDVCKNYKPGR